MIGEAITIGIATNAIWDVLKTGATITAKQLMERLQEDDRTITPADAERILSAINSQDGNLSKSDIEQQLTNSGIFGDVTNNTLNNHGQGSATINNNTLNDDSVLVQGNATINKSDGNSRQIILNDNAVYNETAPNAKKP